jgi:hypothetical protein
LLVKEGREAWANEECGCPEPSRLRSQVVMVCR